MTKPIRVAFLLSGSGTTLENLLRHAEMGVVPAEVVVVLADRPGTGGVERAKKRGIATAVVDAKSWKDPAAFEAAVSEALRPYAPDLVVMGGFLRLWRPPPDLHGRVLNVHPSLLPAFGGKGLYGERVHRAVIDSGVKVTGCTVHFVDDEYDHGPIVAQAAVVVEDGDTPDSLAHRVQEAERRLYPACIRLFAEGRLAIEGRRVRVLPPRPKVGTPTPTSTAPPDPVRARVQALAREALARGETTAWFDRLYREAAGDASRVPWADLEPNGTLAAWAAKPRVLAGVRTAAVVGCGLGDDAELLASKGLDVLGFDVSPTAIEWARAAHPRSRVRYAVGDLFALPADWRGHFDLVVEVYTLQALPSRVRGDAAAAIRSLLAPRGSLFLFTRLRDDDDAPYDEATAGPPWPMTRSEIARYLDGLVAVEPLTETRDPDDPSIARAWGVYRRG